MPLLCRSLIVDIHVNNEIYTVKNVLSGHSNIRPKLVFKTDYRLMQVKSIAERSSLQYFRPLSSYQLSLRSLFCLFLSTMSFVCLFVCLCWCFDFSVMSQLIWAEPVLSIG